MGWFKNMKVGTRLIVGFLLVAAIAAIVSTTGIAIIRKIDASSARLYEKVTVPLSELADIAIAFQRIRVNLREAVYSKDEHEVESAITTLKNLRKSITEKADSFEKTILTDEGRKLFADFKDARNSYAVCINKVLELDAAKREDEAINMMNGECKKAAMKEQDLLDKLMDSKQNQAKLTAEDNASEGRTATIVMSSFAIIGVLIAILLGVATSKSITKPLANAVLVANHLADGDLTVNVDVNSKDETGQLMAAMKNMVQNLRKMIAVTVDISSGIAAASNQLHFTSIQIASGAQKVAFQTMAVSTASEEMTATSNDIARNCTMAAESSQNTTESANSGAKVVQETIHGMSKIAERVRQTSITIEALGTRSEQIGNIIGTIEDIADQTNLLALNAAIEAARAGEQGRGFAVVADEVRALAERTTKATREIGEMIKAIQNETNEAVKAMEEGVAEVERGASSSQKSGHALAEILERIGEVSMQINQIATAAEEQTATTGEITGNILQVTDVVRQTSEGADETAGAAAQLASQAKELQELVSRFKL